MSFVRNFFSLTIILTRRKVMSDNQNESKQRRDVIVLSCKKTILRKQQQQIQYDLQYKVLTSLIVRLKQVSFVIFNLKRENFITAAVHVRQKKSDHKT